tara:strand:- start:427 stop:1008 length:582 start_codon:yes stop_codon:yes gene_type:complete
MVKPLVNIINFKPLYNILFELNNHLNFKINNFSSEQDFIQNIKKENLLETSIIISSKKINNENIHQKSVILLEQLPINFVSLIDEISKRLLKQKYNYQSNIIINKYNLDLNSRTISREKVDLKLTEKEIEIILFLKDQKEPQNILKLQKEVWGYSDDIETHTVETHVYRLRKKLKDTFQDDNFLKSLKEGYKI